MTDEPDDELMRLAEQAERPLMARWVRAGFYRRDFGLTPGWAFYVIICPRPDLTPVGMAIAGWPHLSGWIDWVDFELHWWWGIPNS